MNVTEVYENVSEVVKKARKEHTPALLEIKTYRYKGHSMSDPAKYRTKEELGEYKEKDPILILKKELLDEGVKKDDLEQWDLDAKEASDEAVRFAEESPEPEMEELYTDVLV